MARLAAADRSEFEGRELEQFDDAVTFLTEACKDSGMPGVPAAAGALELLRHSPQHALALWSMGSALMAQHGKPGTWTPLEHEMIDMVLALDAGHYGLLDCHGPLAAAVGIRYEMIEAIRSGHEEELTEDERVLVDFIRGIRDGTLAQDTFDAVRERLGSDRGVVEYAAFVLNLNTHVRLMQAFELPGLSDEELDSMIAGLRDGTWAKADVEQYALANTRRGGS